MLESPTTSQVMGIEKTTQDNKLSAHAGFYMESNHQCYRPHLKDTEPAVAGAAGLLDRDSAVFGSCYSQVVQERHCCISRKAFETVELSRDAPEVLFTMVMLYQPEGVSLRLHPKPESNAFRLMYHLVNQRPLRKYSELHR